MTGTLKFRPDIEGLRALAIVPVVVFHAFPTVLPGGYVGVDIFFVISGFLITSLLMQRLAANEFSIASFYGARIRRIFPALFCVLVAVLPAALWFLPPIGLAEFARTLGATSLFVSNVELYRTTGYFDGAAGLKPLLHTWSLAVEEQYYIMFPLLLAVLYRRWRPAIVWVLLGIGLASFAGSVWLVQSNPPLAFYSAASRTFELMIGSLLAARPQRLTAPRWVREALAFLGFFGIGAACWRFSVDTPFPGWAALVPCAGTALMIWAGEKGTTVVGRIASVPPLRLVGAMSFSLYLWHWPVLVFTHHALMGEPDRVQAAIAVLFSLVMAYASWRWVETPVRRTRATDRRLMLGAAVCITLMLLAAWQATEAAKRWQQTSTRANVLLAGASDINTRRTQCHGGQDDLIPYRDRCRFGNLSSARDTAVWADSHGAELALALGESAAATGYAIAQITSSTCPPAPDFVVPTRPLCKAHNRAMLQALAADPGVDRVVMIARYNVYLGMDGPAFEAALRHGLQVLTAAGKPVLLVDPFPEYGYPVPAALAMMSRHGRDAAAFEQPLAEYRTVNREALAMLGRLSALPGVTRVSTSQVLCATGRCAVVAGDKPLYFDDNHLSMTGARLLAATIVPLLPTVR